ncbi:MAG: type I secretion C-terminal target domain-containing protein [Rhodospirillaceae bacterium]|nr:type I secretion C-terminal target domain-containing protein [Rhodospirillaceae bacterium]
MTDADGDTVPLDDALTLVVEDDIPVNLNVTPIAKTVHEDALAGGNFEGGQVTTVTVTAAELASQVSVGADAPGTFSLNTGVSGDVLTTGGLAATSLGETVTWNVNGAVIEGVAGGRVVFTIAETSSGVFTITLFDQIDHLPNVPANDDGQTLSLDLSGALLITDADGDTAVLDDALTLVVEDDTPEAQADRDRVAVAAIVVVGNVIDGTVTDGIGGEDSVGADGPQATVVSVSSDAPVAPIVPDANGETIEGLYGTLTIQSNGSYSYALTATSVPEDAEDVFTYTIEDSDGDRASTTLTIELPKIDGLVVGENVDDIPGETTDHRVDTVDPGGEGDIVGGLGADILIGDVGGGSLEGQTANVILVLDVSGSMETFISYDVDGDGTSESVRRIVALDTAVERVLDSYANTPGATVVVRMIAFESSIRAEQTFTIVQDGVVNQAQLDAAKAFILSASLGDNPTSSEINAANSEGAVVADGFTNYEAGFLAAQRWLGNGDNFNGTNATGLPIANADINQTIFISDGAPNRSVRVDANGNILESSNNGISDGQGDLNQVLGIGETGNSEPDVAGSELQALINLGSSVDAIGLAVGTSADNLLNQIDDDGDASNVTNGNQLETVLLDLAQQSHLSAAGDDTLIGNDGNDLIFGDTLHTDILADAEGLGTVDGAGWAVFEQLEAGNGSGAADPTSGDAWTRADTIAYIRAHAAELAQESVDSEGNGRAGGNDTIFGGAGDDIIFGQEGNDIIFGGDGSDILSGGSGSDTFGFLSTDTGIDTILDFDFSNDANPDNDVLDLSDLLSGVAGIDQTNIGDYVQVDAGGNVFVDADGTGAGAAQQVATIDNATSGATVDIQVYVDPNLEVTVS